MALFVTRPEEATPWALRALADRMQSVPEHVVVVSVAVFEVPHVAPGKRGELVLHATHGGDVAKLELRFGFNDRQALPQTIQDQLTSLLTPSQLAAASYIVSSTTFEMADDARGFRRWHQRLYIWTTKWGIDPIRYHDLPPERTILLGHVLRLP